MVWSVALAKKKTQWQLIEDCIPVGFHPFSGPEIVYTLALNESRQLSMVNIPFPSFK